MLLSFYTRGDRASNVRRIRLPALYVSYTFFSPSRKHFLTVELQIFLYRHVLGTREMLVGLYREISRFSRDLVGRAVALDGGALGSRGLGPATLSTRQVVREGPGTSASWCREARCVSFL